MIAKMKVTSFTRREKSSDITMKKLSKSDRIGLVELSPTQHGELDGELSYDVYSHFRLPPRALPTLTAVLRQDGWNTEMITPLYHGQDNKLSPDNYKDIFSSRVLGISAITRTSPQSMALADRYKAKNPDGLVVAGGMDASKRIEDWLEHADVVVIGEGERTVSELVQRFSEDPGNLQDLDGIAYKKGKEIIVNTKRKLMTEKELAELPSPHYDNAIRNNVVTGAIESERGCPFNCDYCTVNEIYGSTIRYFPVQRTLGELRELRNWKRNSGAVFFTGDNLAGNPRKSIKLLDAIKEAGLYRDTGIAQVSVSAAKNPRFLQAMRSAGIRYLCVGFESVSDNSLKEIGKPFTAKQNTEAAKTFREWGFWIHAMMMLGTDSDTPETAKESLEWVKQHADSMQMFTVTPMPGTRYYEKMREQGRILTDDWSLYDAHHCVIQPANFSPLELQETCEKAHKEFYSPRETLRRLGRHSDAMLSFGLMSYVFTGGLRKVMKSPQTKKYADFLKRFRGVK